MTHERSMDIAVMGLEALRAELQAVNEKIDASAETDDSGTNQSPDLWALFDEQAAIEDRIDMIGSGAVLDRNGNDILLFSAGLATPEERDRLLLASLNDPDLRLRIALSLPPEDEDIQMENAIRD